MLVSDDGQELLFQFGTKPWSQMEFPYEDGTRGPGMTVPVAVLALDIGVYPLAFPGYIYKCFDKASGQSYIDPRLEAEIQ